MRVTEALLPDSTIDDSVETIGYGIAYWAKSAPDDLKAKAFETPGAVSVFMEDEGVGDTDEPIILTYEGIREAFGKLLAIDQPYVNREIHGYFIDSFRERDDNGIDAGFIDADAGDVLAQVAAFGKVVYG